MVMPTCKQPFMGIWFHDNKLSDNEKKQMKIYLNHTFYYYLDFTNLEEFILYINRSTLITKVFLIISHKKLYISIEKLIQFREKTFQKYYIYLPQQPRNETCCIISDMKALFGKISIDISQYFHYDNNSLEENFDDTGLLDRGLPLTTVFNTNTHRSTPIRHLTKDSLNFLCILTMIKIICETSSYNSEDKVDMWTTCRQFYRENQAQLDHIRQLESDYDPRDAIMYYTKYSCLSHHVNKACHTENITHIFKFRVYMNDLHTNLRRHYERIQQRSFIQKLYRGKPISEGALQQLIDNIGNLISINGFLSTTIDDRVALKFAGDLKGIKNGQRSVLFVFENHEMIKTPYADIANYSTKQDEKEVLFSPGAVWRVKSVQFNESKQIYEVELTAYNQLDSQLDDLFTTYTEDKCTMESVGDILVELGDYKSAESFYKNMLDRVSSNDDTCGILYYKIAMIRYKKAEYDDAFEYFEKAKLLLSSSSDRSEEIGTLRLLYINDSRSPLFAIYNNMATIYKYKNMFNKSISYYKKALELKHDSIVEIATVYNNLGLLYFSRNEYKEAREHHLKAIELIDESYSEWIEFKRNYDNNEERYQNITNKKQN